MDQRSQLFHYINYSRVNFSLVRKILTQNSTVYLKQQLSKLHFLYNVRDRQSGGTDEQSELFNLE